jgi:hypothetical protein
MAYREVTMLEVNEVLRPCLGGTAHKRIAAQLGLNVKTVRCMWGWRRRAASPGRRDRRPCLTT